MSRFSRNLVLSASLLLVALSAGLTQAATVRNAISRHQHPERGFFSHTGHQHPVIYRAVR